MTSPPSPASSWPASTLSTTDPLVPRRAALERRLAPPRPMTRARGTPVMADVARRAGVAPITVSRVVNGHPLVTPETRARVQQAIDELGYRSNMAARTLAGGRSRVLGAVGVETEFYGPSRTLFGIEAAARATGHLVSFVTVREPTVDEMRASLDHLRDVHVEGVIVIAPVVEAVRGTRRRQARRPARRHRRHRQRARHRQPRPDHRRPPGHRPPPRSRTRDRAPRAGCQRMARRRRPRRRLASGTARAGSDPSRERWRATGARGPDTRPAARSPPTRT